MKKKEKEKLLLLILGRFFRLSLVLICLFIPYYVGYLINPTETYFILMWIKGFVTTAMVIVIALIVVLIFRFIILPIINWVWGNNF